MGELQVVNEQSPAIIEGGNSPAAMMMQAISSGMDMDKLAQFMELQERWEANEARKAYHDAMAQFKANPPEILKDRKVSYKAGGGVTEYTHASLANVARTINTALSKYGLSAAWKTAQEERGVTVTCTITHKLGHSESTSLTAAPDNSGSKNSIQAVGSTISYLERYTVLALTGLATEDMDDDGVGAVEYITTDQAIEITDKISDTETDTGKFLKYLSDHFKMDIENVQKIPAKGYKVAIAALKAKEKSK